MEFRLKLKEGSKAVKQRPYSMSKFEEDWLKGELDKMFKLDVLTEVADPEWLSPVVIAKHPQSGKLRLCLDMRQLNACTELQPHPIPKVEEVVNSMTGCQFFSQIDISKDFWHIPVAAEDIPTLGFATPWGNFAFKRMPFGLVNAPSVWQKCMDTVFQGVHQSKTYIDDTFVFTNGWREHVSTLGELFARCRQYNISINLEKCNFGVESVKCLGYVVSRTGVHVDEDKVSAILSLPTPECVKDVKSFLGMAGYFRHFIEGFASISGPLAHLTKKAVRFKWCTECQSAFDKLKIALTSAPCLRLPDWDRQFILHVDWSQKAIGVVLSQKDDSGCEYPVAFASRLLTPAEQRYAPLEAECLALVWATFKFRYYLHGRKFLVHTDHKSLEWLQATRFENNKVERWALRLQEFQFDIIYKKGEENVVADCLSRFCGLQLDSIDPALRVGALFSLGLYSNWPAAVLKQSDLDAVPCTICDHPGGWDNMAICSMCGDCYHLRCVFPPMSTVPSGTWLCPACDPVYRNWDELRDTDTPLTYHSHDPHMNPALLLYLESGMIDEALPSDAKQAQKVRQLASAVRLHPTLPGWLQVHRKRGTQGQQWLSCPPVEFRWDLLRVYHDALGHCGVTQLVGCMHQHFHWGGISLDAKRFVKACDACQRRKLALPELPPLQQPVVHAGPFRHIHVDLAGPFETPLISVHGKITEPERPVKAYVVLMIDYFTKAAEFYIVYSKHAVTVAEAVYYGWFCRYGCCEFVTSDNGAEFEAEFRHQLQRLGIQHIHTSACHPAANGAVERLVRSFKDILCKFINDHPAHWVQSVPRARTAYMSRLHAALGVTPFEMLHGCKPRLAVPLGVQLGAASFAQEHQAEGDEADVLSRVEADEYLQHLQSTFGRLDNLAFKGIHKQFEVNRKYLEKRGSDFARKASNALAVGDLVLELDDNPDTALNAKVRGPYRLVALEMEGALAVLETGATGFKPAHRFRRHVSRLAKHFDKSTV
jgi:hypothetical protein